MKNNEEVLSLVYKIRDGLEYEVDEKGIVIILKRQDHWIQRSLENIDE